MGLEGPKGWVKGLWFVGSRSWGLGAGRDLGVWVAKDLGFRGPRVWGLGVWGLRGHQGLGSVGPRAGV